jgi:nitrogenase molybdenum-iron protein alpha chain
LRVSIDSKAKVKIGNLSRGGKARTLFEEFAKKLNPDLIAAGIKEKYVFQKMALPFRQMHSWDYSGPYHGYEGFAVFARDMDLAIKNPTWDLIKNPWDK